jgi:lysophospholipase L1-like esterase
MPNGYQTIDSAMDTILWRTRHVINEDTPTLQLVEPVFQVAGTYAEVQRTPAAGTIFIAALEVSATMGGATPTSLNQPLTFGGAASPTGTMLGGAGGLADKTFASDTINASAFGLAKFTKGDVVFLRRGFRFPAINPFWISTSDDGSAGFAGSEGCRVNAGGAFETIVSGTGNFSGTAGTTAANRLLRPFLLIGQHAGVAIIGIGDSITDGKGSNRSGDGSAVNAYGGYFIKAAYDAGKAHLKSGKDGNTLANWANSTLDHSTRLAALQYFTHATVLLGTNDANVGRTAAQMLTDHASVRARLVAANPALKILGGKMIPRATSTDNWVTLANQTPRSYTLSGALYDQYEAGLDAAVGTNMVATFSLRAGAADPVETNKWRVNGTVQYACVDEAHPTQATAIDMAALLQPLLAGASA